jgi:hypothetical protein
MTRDRFTMSRILALAGLVIVLAGWLAAQGPDETLAKEFKSPPDSAKPRAWWHWMNGNVTAEGITADLEWMKHAGIEGNVTWSIRVSECSGDSEVRACAFS